jgi:heterotetrameric sarcosine oxidase gamma subunit
MPRVVVVGAGIVGVAVADELTRRGWPDVTVVDQGPLWAAGGSTSHAPGLVFQCNASRAMIEFATYTVAGLCALDLDGRPCFHQVGSLEVASTPERVRELHRRAGWLAAAGVEARIVGADEAVARQPMLDRGQVLAALHVPTDGVATAVRAVEALARRATTRGARFLERHEVLGPVTRDTPAGPAVTGVATDRGILTADHVVMCGGLWAPELAERLNTTAPLLALAHQLAWTGPVAPLAGRTAEIDTPVVRWQEQDLYFRQRGDGWAVGWYGHAPKPVHASDLPRYDDAEVMPSVLPFTPSWFDEAWKRSTVLSPSLADADVVEAIDGIFSFTQDGFPLLGPAPDVRGLWAAEAVWITHSLGVARALAEWLVDGRPSTDVHECDIRRFAPHQLAPAYVRARGERNYVEVYDLLHPLQPMEHPRPLRTTAFRPRQEAQGAVFLEASGWERPQWYAGNEDGLDHPDLTGLSRDDWSSRFWSPTAAVEAHTTRTHVALYDMTSLVRIEVTGRGAEGFLRQLTTGRVERPVGTVTYCLVLGPHGRVLSDVTVARLGRDRYQVGANSQTDVAVLTEAAADRSDVFVRDGTGGTVCLGLWGPRAREVLAPLTRLDLSNATLPYFRAARTHLDMVPVTLLRVSYVGELGWEIYTEADMALRLWDTLWESGSRVGMRAAGRAAFTSLRLEKGYRSYGTDMTDEHTPAEAGLAWAVRRDGGFVGAAAVGAAVPPTRRLVTLHLTDPDVVPMGKEPLLGPHDEVVGYVTSAAYGHAVDRPVALGWVPATMAAPGTGVGVRWFERRLEARVAPTVSYDPEMARLRA